VLDGFERELRAYGGLSAAYAGDLPAEDADLADLTCIDPHAAQFLRGIAALPLKGRVLITSRLFPHELDGASGCRREDLLGLQPVDAVAFFHAHGVRGIRAEIEAVCRPWDYHPLALRVLAGFIARDHRFRGDVQAAARHLDEVLPELTGTHGHTPILRVAYDSLDGPVRELLSRIAAFRGAVDYDAILAISEFEDERALDAALDELVDRGLLMREGGQYALHPLVRRYAYVRLGDPKGVHEQLRGYFTGVPEPDRVENLEDLRQSIELYHHTARAGRYEDACDLLYERLFSALYYQLGATTTCVELLRQLFPDGEDAPPRLSVDTDRAWALNALANSYDRCGQLRRAVQLGIEGALVYELADYRFDLATALQNLASRCLELGQMRNAEDYLRRSIKLCKASPEPFSEATGQAYLGGVAGA